MDNTAENLSNDPPNNTPLSNLMHELFCNEYLKDFNGTQAYERAGYEGKGARQSASALLTSPVIQARLSELTRERFSRVKLDADYVLKTAHDIVKRCMQEVEPVMAHGLHVTDRVTNRPLYTFQAQTAVKALEIMGKHVAVGAFTPDLNMNAGNINVLIGARPCTCGLCTCQNKQANNVVVGGAPTKELSDGAGES